MPDTLEQCDCGEHAIVYMVCCRVWPIIFGEPARRCGICGEAPRGFFYTKEDAEAALATGHTVLHE